MYYCCQCKIINKFLFFFFFSSILFCIKFKNLVKVCLPIAYYYYYINHFCSSYFIQIIFQLSIYSIFCLFYFLFLFVRSAKLFQISMTYFIDRLNISLFILKCWNRFFVFLLQNKQQNLSYLNRFVLNDKAKFLMNKLAKVFLFYN